MREFVIPLATGLAIFLFGMQVLRIGLHALTGERMRHWLHQFTQTPFISFMTGLISTAVLQSSSAVTVLAIGLVNSGALRFSRCIGLILGTNLGTCITTELLAFSVEDYAVTLLLAGALCWLMPSRKLRFTGLALGGLGCIFLGMQTMESVARSFDQLGMLEFFSAYDSAGWGVVTWTLLTALIQSSSAAVALLMGLYSVKAVSLTFALAAVLGSNVGTCITAWIASVGGNRTGKQVAMAHLLINVAGLVAFYPMITLLSDWMASTGLSRHAQIAHFQTGFNLVSALALLPFCGFIARVVRFLIPDR